MKACDAPAGQKHFYDETKWTQCPKCIDALIGSATSGAVVNVEPPLCTDCHHIATSYDRDLYKHRCLAVENYAGKNLVDGSKVYYFPFCYQLREADNNHPNNSCGWQGRNWKKNEYKQKPIASVDYTPIDPDKIPEPRLRSVKNTKLTPDDLDNL